MVCSLLANIQTLKMFILSFDLFRNLMSVFIRASHVILTSACLISPKFCPSRTDFNATLYAEVS